MKRRSQSPRSLFLIGAALIVAVGIGWFLAKRSLEELPLPPVGPLQSETGGQRVLAHLYFGDSQRRFLTSEQRAINRPASASAYARLLVDILIAGPKQGASRTLPETARVRALYVTSDGIAYIDFFEDAFEQHPGGVEAELISIYSLINTLVLNIEEIRFVKILVGGKEAATLVGHVDLSPLYKADMLWIR
jgi:hypothetical protein